jgi:hypothetical protein
MADIQQVWEGHDGWKVLGIRYYVHQDFDKNPDITDAFDLVISARVFGPQIGQCIVDPLKNTNPLTMQLVGGVLGSIQGQLDDWQGYMPDGKTKGEWAAGGLGSARFLLTLDIDISVPAGPLHIPIKVKAFHKPCTVLLHWNAQTKKYSYIPQ